MAATAALTHLDMSVHRYAKVGLKRLGLATDVSESQEERAQKKLGRWREVVAFFSLRLCLLPVVETVILLDRMLFLAQNGTSSNKLWMTGWIQLYFSHQKFSYSYI